jgi:RNA polymerase sigma-70 factor (ECF subfamily)
MSQIDRIALNEAIDQLSPGYRLVFILHDLEGYEHEQIGKILGCAIGTSKSQLHKARLRLRQLLAGRRPTPRKLDHARAKLASSFNLKLQQIA